MKKILLLPVIAALSFFSACNKQQSDADRQAEIDREVQRKLEAEHQAQEREDLARREGELKAREEALAQNQNTPAESREETEERTTRTQDRHVQDRQPQPGGDYALFYSKLEPHGDWIDTSDYGYVFHPREAERSSWRPYADGRWVYTEAGWTWVSEEPFGWATYHYGRWVRLRTVGWVWIPGDEWAPAWVSWRKSDSYVGWAPLPPEARFDHRTGIHNWADSYYDIGPENYCFVETREFGAPRAERVIVPSQQNLTIVNQTTNVTNITYNNTTIVNQGPSYDEIRTRSAQPVQRLKLERDVNVNINVGEPRSVVRADALVMIAPVISQTRVVEKPKIVKKTVTNVVVERGWEGVKDRQAADKARAKIRSEATPPPKTFVKAAASEPATPSATAAKVEASATAVPTTAPGATAMPKESATATATATATPPQTTASVKPKLRPRPLSASPSPGPSAAEGAMVPPGATATASRPPGFNVRGPDGKFRSVRKVMEPPNASPNASASPASSASATATPAASASAPSHDRELRRPMLTPAPSASPEASARSTSTPAAASPSASEASSPLSRENKREMRREEKQERKRERREAREGLTSPSPSPTP